MKTLKPKQNSCHLEDDILNTLLWMKVVFWMRFNWSLSLRVQSKSAHYNNYIMGTVTSQITSLAIVYSAVYSGADQRKYQGSASLAFEWGMHRGPVNSPHKGPVTRKMFSFDDVIMISQGTGVAPSRWWAITEKMLTELYDTIWRHKATRVTSQPLLLNTLW